MAVGLHHRVCRLIAMDQMKIRTPRTSQLLNQFSCAVYIHAAADP